MARTQQAGAIPPWLPLPFLSRKITTDDSRAELPSQEVALLMGSPKGQAFLARCPPKRKSRKEYGSVCAFNRLLF